MARRLNATDTLRQRGDAFAGLGYTGWVFRGFSERFGILALVVSEGGLVVGFGLVRFVGEGCCMHHATRGIRWLGNEMAGTDLGKEVPTYSSFRDMYRLGRRMRDCVKHWKG